MLHPDRSYSRNMLLGALSAEDLALLKPHFTRHDIAREDVLVTAGAPIEHVYFLEAGVASTVAAIGSSRPTEVGIFGRDGVSATCLLLGSDRSPHQTFIQVGDGTALRIDAAPYLAAIRASETLRTTLLRYVQAMLVQAAHSTATNAHHRIESRLARWLLMCHDRVDGDEIAITHEFIGMMIAAERSGVTVSLHILEGAGMIHSRRGRVIIRDRDKLEELAGDSYGVPEAEYRHLVGPLGRSSSRRTDAGGTAT
jgi:CRP-like cAMP-binding protein